MLPENHSKELRAFSSKKSELQTLQRQETCSKANAIKGGATEEGVRKGQQKPGQWSRDPASWGKGGVVRSKPEGA